MHLFPPWLYRPHVLHRWASVHGGTKAICSLVQYSRFATWLWLVKSWTGFIFFPQEALLWSWCTWVSWEIRRIRVLHLVVVGFYPGNTLLSLLPPVVLLSACTCIMAWDFATVAYWSRCSWYIVFHIHAHGLVMYFVPGHRPMCRK